MTRCICLYCEEDGGIHLTRCRELVTDDRWGLWCNDCNSRRFARIDAGFAAVVAAAEGSQP